MKCSAEWCRYKRKRRPTCDYPPPPPFFFPHYFGGRIGDVQIGWLIIYSSSLAHQHPPNRHMMQPTSWCRSTRLFPPLPRTLSQLSSQPFSHLCMRDITHHVPLTLALTLLIITISHHHTRIAHLYFGHANPRLNGFFKGWCIWFTEWSHGNQNSIYLVVHLEWVLARHFVHSKSPMWPFQQHSYFQVKNIYNNLTRNIVLYLRR